MLAVTTSSCPSSRNGACKTLEDPLGEVEHVLGGLDVFDEDDELVSPEPGDRVAVADDSPPAAG